MEKSFLNDLQENKSGSVKFIQQRIFILRKEVEEWRLNYSYNFQDNLPQDIFE